MKISLIMAVYNGEKYLIKQLQSINNQTNKIDEVTDRTLIDKFHKIFDAQFDIFEISAKNKINTKKLINKLYSVITKENKKSTRSLENDEFVYKINSSIAGEIPDYQIEKLDDHLFKIVGDRVIRTKRLINLKTDELIQNCMKPVHEMVIPFS